MHGLCKTANLNGFKLVHHWHIYRLLVGTQISKQIAISEEHTFFISFCKDVAKYTVQLSKYMIAKLVYDFLLISYRPIATKNIATS